MAKTASMEAPASFSAPEDAADPLRGRRQDFNLFKRIARDFFRRPPADEGHRRMAARCGYSVAFGGETPCRAVEPLGCEARAVEVFYGEHDLGGFRALAQTRLSESWRAASEKGASLLYVQGEDSVVTVYLHPAETACVKAEEDAILLARYQDLEGLTGRGVLESHWRALRAYAEATSLDGEPSLGQIALIRWLRFSRPVIRDGRRRAARVIGATETLLGFASAVLLSAWVIASAG